MFLGSVRQSSKAQSKEMPAPTGGWNAKDSLTDMKPNHAVILDNYFPEPERVRLRQGYAAYATGMTGNIDTLLVYTGLTGSQKMFAAIATAVYNVSLAGAVGAAVLSSKTNGRWQYTHMGTAGGQFMFMCNGADTPQLYDGTNFADTTLTGPTVTNVIWCQTHQRRIWIGEKDKLSAWYGGVNAITGAFTEFPLHGVAQLGGYIMGMATWTRDGGSGADDVAIFVTSQGEAIVYSGYDPSDAATWSLVGVFRIGKPIGRRFAIKAGADVILITEDGFVSASSILQTDRSQAGKAAFSDQINKAVNSVVRSSGSNFGWQPILYPRGTMLIVNIPYSATTSYQYVFNTITQAPCRFVGMNANCWEVFGDNIYFGGKDGKVYKADTGATDNGSAIVGDILPAFSYFGSKGNKKKFCMCETVFEGDAQVNPSMKLYVDFKRPANMPSTTSVLAGTGAVWDSGLWDAGVWAGSEDVFRSLKSVTGYGRAGSLRIKTSTKTTRPALLSINYVFQLGGMV